MYMYKCRLYKYKNILSHVCITCFLWVNIINQWKMYHKISQLAIIPKFLCVFIYIEKFLNICLRGDKGQYNFQSLMFVLFRQLIFMKTVQQNLQQIPGGYFISNCHNMVREALLTSVPDSLGEPLSSRTQRSSLMQIFSLRKQQEKIIH